MEEMNKINKVFFGPEGEVIFTRKEKRRTMICPYSQNEKKCSHNCPLLVEMQETATMERSEMYLQFCNGEMIELSGDERK